jgi:thioredoxin-dependent peroxiredoxin
MAGQSRCSSLSSLTLGMVALAGCAGGQSAHAETPMLGVGASAPDLSGTDADGKRVRLSAVKGKFAAVYFYPKDDTPGCTKEACAFRDAFDKYKRAGVVIFGVSRDSEASHVQFRKKHKLPFPLVADESGEVQRAYGVPSKFEKLAARVTFLVDPQGKIVRVWPDVDPGVHATEVLAAVQQLQEKR